MSAIALVSAMPHAESNRETGASALEFDDHVLTA